MTVCVRGMSDVILCNENRPLSFKSNEEGEKSVESLVSARIIRPFSKSVLPTATELSQSHVTSTPLRHRLSLSPSASNDNVKGVSSQVLKSPSPSKSTGKQTLSESVKSPSRYPQGVQVSKKIFICNCFEVLYSYLYSTI